MAGQGAAPKANRARENAPARGDWQYATDLGWSHGDLPSPPDGLKAESVEAWNTWMGAWYASFWTPQDLPALRIMASLYDQVVRGEYQRSAELRLQMDTWGVTPKGQQDRRWAPPREAEPTAQKQASKSRAPLKAVK